MKLPQNLPQIQMENAWATLIEPFLNNPPNNPVLLKNISLSTGSNTINHRLGRKLIGWKITRIRSAATIYDEQDSNTNPQLTLILNSSAPALVDLECF